MTAATNGEVRTTSSTGAQKGVKPEAFDLIPARPLRLLAQFYGTETVDFNEAAGMSQVFNYVNEKLWEFWFGEDIDSDSGLPNIVAAGAGCLALVDFVNRPNMDDRPGPNVTPVGFPLPRRAFLGQTAPPLRYDKIPYSGLIEMARHYDRGALKYARNNWAAGYEWSKPYAALQRHLWSFWNREDIDEETGSLHITASAWHCFTMTEFLFTHRSFDDRAIPGTMLTRMDQPVPGDQR